MTINSIPVLWSLLSHIVGHISSFTPSKFAAKAIFGKRQTNSLLLSITYLVASCQQDIVYNLIKRHSVDAALEIWTYKIMGL